MTGQKQFKFWLNAEGHAAVMHFVCSLTVGSTLVMYGNEVVACSIQRDTCSTKPMTSCTQLLYIDFNKPLKHCSEAQGIIMGHINFTLQSFNVSIPIFWYEPKSTQYYDVIFVFYNMRWHFINSNVQLSIESLGVFRHPSDFLLRWSL